MTSLAGWDVKDFLEFCHCHFCLIDPFWYVVSPWIPHSVTSTASAGELEV